MSLVQKIFPNRSGYVLQVSDLSVAGSAAQLRRAPYAAVSKRILAVVLGIAFILLTSASGFFMATKAAPKASADWVSDIFCTSLENGDISTQENNSYGATGASNEVYAFGQSAAGGLSALFTSGILSIKSTTDAQKTAYETFTPFLPVFDSWKGYYVATDAPSTDTLVFHYPLNVSGDGAPSNILNVTYGNTSNQTLATSALFAHNVGADCMAGPAGKAFGTTITNNLFMIPKLVTFFSAEIYGWAYQNAAISNNGSILHTLLYGTAGKNDGLNAVITGTSTSQGLKDVLYLPFLLPIVMLAALWILYNALIKKRTNSATQGAIWLVAASITGLLFLNHPDWVPAWSDTIVTTVDGATVNALNGSSESKTNSTVPEALCGLSGTQTTEKTVRELKCYMWYNTIYVPWVSGQFGTGVKITGGANVLTQNAGFTSVTAKNAHTPAADNTILDKTSIALGSNTLKNPSGAVNGTTDAQGARWLVNWGTFELQEQARNWHNTKANQINALAFSQLSGNEGSPVNTTWGGDFLRQANAAGLASIASIGTMILVLSSGFLLLTYQISMIFLIMLSPFFFLIGALPGLGRGIMMRWFELIASTIIKRIILTFVVALFLRMYTVVMGLTSLPWYMQVLLMIIIAVVAMSQRANIVNTFAKSIDFGGNKNIGDGTDGAKTFGRRLASGAALAGLGALGAKGGFGAVGGTGSKLKTAAGVVGNLTGKGPGAGGAGSGVGGIGGGDGGDNPGLTGAGADGIDPSATDINGLPLGDTNPDVDGPHIVTEELPPIIMGTEYEAQIVVVGAPKPDLTVTGLPAGLSFSPSDGKITGTPERAGTSLPAGANSNASIEVKITAKAVNAHGDDEKEYDVRLFNGGSAGDKAMEDYRNNQAIRGSDISRAKDMASEASYERARLAAEANGKPELVKGKHSPDAYNKRMAAAVGPAPDPDKFANKADYAKAMATHNQELDAYKEKNPYADFAGDSILRKRRKAEITGQIDPMTQARLDARSKAIKTAALGGFERGFVENKDGSLKLDRGALYRQYRDGYILGDVKSTNTEIKLDSKQDRIEAAETRGLLSRQIQLQEETLRLQGGVVPPMPGGDNTPPPMGGGSGPLSPITGSPRTPVSAPTVDNGGQGVPVASYSDEPVISVGPDPRRVEDAPVTSQAGKSQEQLRQEILKGRQENAQERARLTGGTPQKITAPPKPRQRVQVDPTAQQRPISTPTPNPSVSERQARVTPAVTERPAPKLRDLPQINGYQYPGLSTNRDIRNTVDLAALDKEIQQQQTRLDANTKMAISEQKSRGWDSALEDRVNYNAVHEVDIQNLLAIADNARASFANGEMQQLPEISGYDYPGLSVDRNVQSPEDLSRLEAEIANQRARLEANQRAEERQRQQTLDSNDPGTRANYEDRRNYNTVHAVDIQNLEAIAGQARSSFGSSSDGSSGGSVSFAPAPQPQVRTAPAPAPRKPATSAPAPRQQQTQQQLRVTPAPAAAPRKPSTPAPAPQAPQQQTQQQQVRPAPAPAPKKPPVKLPPIKINIDARTEQPAEPTVQYADAQQPLEQVVENNAEYEKTLQQETAFLQRFAKDQQRMDRERDRIERNLRDAQILDRRNHSNRSEAVLRDAQQDARRYNQGLSGFKGKISRYNQIADDSARLNPSNYDFLRDERGNLY